MRAFVAIEITDQNTLDSIRRFQEGLDIDARPVRTENLHLTLQFLGEMSEETAAGVVRALETTRFPEFEIELAGVGAFPGFRNPRVIWIGTKSDRLAGLAEEVHKALGPLGLEPDKPFRPHLTVFRIKKKLPDITGELKGMKTTYFGTQTVTKIKLKESRLGPDGPSYTDLLEIRAT